MILTWKKSLTNLVYDDDLNNLTDNTQIQTNITLPENHEIITLHFCF